MSDTDDQEVNVDCPHCEETVNVFYTCSHDVCELCGATLVMLDGVIIECRPL